jgi:hypothetical protein
MRYLSYVFILFLAAACSGSNADENKSAGATTAQDAAELADSAAYGDTGTTPDNTGSVDGTVSADASALSDAAVQKDGATSDAGSMSVDGAITSDASQAGDATASDASAGNDAAISVDAAAIPAICLLPPETGNCYAYLERFAYNSQTGACEMFVYGGCGGNENNFETEAECLQACAPGSSDPSTAASCKVGGTVYASGTGNIKDPYSCNTCQCTNGALGCTKMMCPEDCPPNSAPGESCASCGPTDACEVVEIGCLPTCDTSTDCNGTGYFMCFDNVCKNVCG